jgi:hypothetical protein
MHKPHTLECCVGATSTSKNGAVHGRERPLRHMAVLLLEQKHGHGHAGEVILPNQVGHGADDTLERKLGCEGQLHAPNGR